MAPGPGMTDTPALERAFAAGRPALVDVVIDPNVSYGNMGGRSRQQRQY